MTDIIIYEDLEVAVPVTGSVWPNAGWKRRRPRWICWPAP